MKRERKLGDVYPTDRGWRRALRRLKQFVRDPAQWSAEHYRHKHTYDCVAVRQDKWEEDQE